MMSLPVLAATIRRIRRRRLDSLVNIAGLGAGLACALSILLWARYERSFDRFHSKAGGIYRLVDHGLRSGEPIDLARVPGPLGPALAETCPEIRRAVRVWTEESILRRPGGTAPAFRLRTVAADPAFLEIFDFPLTRGDRTAVLLDPRSVLLAEASARALFGSEDPLGGTVQDASGNVLTVTGILRDVPENSHLRFDAVLPYRSVTLSGIRGFFDDWRQYFVSTYVWVPGPVATADLEAKITALADARDGNGRPDRLWLQPLARIHLDDRVFREGGEAAGVDARTIALFSLVAFLVLLMACLNYTNLAAAQAFSRAREVGVRKATGASRRDLVRQFLTETLITVGFALTAAVLLASSLLPLLRRLTGRRLDPSLLDPTELAAGAGLVFAAAVVLAGIYPALALASMDPVKSLKIGASSGGGGAVRLRKASLLVQFAVIASLLGITGSILRQLSFMAHKDLGFDRRNIIELDGAPELDAHAGAWKSALLAKPGVLGVSNSQTPFVEGLAYKKRSFDWQGRSPGLDVLFTSFFMDYDFLEAYGARLAEGRFFSPDRPGDRDAVLINRAAVRAMELREPLGTRFFLGRGRSAEVIGVIEDFHVASMRRAVDPMICFLAEHGAPLTIRLNPVGVRDTLRDIESLWRSFVPEAPFRFRDLDDILAEFYARDATSARIVAAFTAFAVVIALLGLYGLVAFQAERRTKEIGIRKILGASTSRILALLSAETGFVLLVSGLLSVAPVLLVSERWLRPFAYRIDVAWWQFAAAAAVLTLATGGTIAAHVLKVSRKNPVESLRAE